MKKKIFPIIFVAAAAILLILVFATAPNLQKQAKPTDKLTAAASIFPLYDFARAVGGSDINLLLIAPPGADPHNFELSPGDIVNIANAQVFIYLGNGIDLWAEKIAKMPRNSQQIIVNAGKGINAPDLHSWLDFSNAQIMIDNIAQGFAAADPKHKDFYWQNAADYKKRLADLDAEYRRTLTNCNVKIIVESGHDVFNCWAAKYNLTYLPTQNANPDAESTPVRLSQLADVIKNNNLRYIFYEEPEGKKNAQMLSELSKTQLLPLNSAETITPNDFQKGVDFIGIMEKNLNNLKIGLQCQ